MTTSTEEEEFEFRARLEAESQPRDLESSAAGITKEIGKGLLRGAGEVGTSVPKAVGTMMFGPLGGDLISRGVDILTKPSMELVKATPATRGEKFAGTASEILGGAAVGGGVTSGVRKAGTSLAAALGGATGEQGGGDWGKLFGILAGAGGYNAAVSLAKKLGTNLADLGAIIGTSFLDSKRGINRLTAQAAQTRLGNDPAKIAEVRQAIQRPTEYIRGSPVTVAESLAEASLAGPKQVGGALIRLQKDLTGAAGVEDVGATVAKQQKSALQVHLRDLEKAAAPLREDTARSVRAAGGINPSLVTSIIDMKLSKAGVKATDLTRKILEDIKGRILDLPGAKRTNLPRISFEDLYAKRKEVGNVISRHAREAANWDSKMTAGLEREVQRAMDQAIIMSGGNNWRRYMNLEAAGHQAARSQIARKAEAQRIARGVKGQPISELVPGELPKPPTLLSRKMMAANFVLRMLERDANTPVVKEMTRRLMQDPKAFDDLLKKPMGTPQRDAAEFILNALRTSGRISATVDQPGGNP